MNRTIQATTSISLATTNRSTAPARKLRSLTYTLRSSAIDQSSLITLRHCSSILEASFRKDLEGILAYYFKRRRRCFSSALGTFAYCFNYFRAQNYLLVLLKICFFLCLVLSCDFFIWWFLIYSLSDFSLQVLKISVLQHKWFT